MDRDVKLLAEEGNMVETKKGYSSLFRQHPDCHRYVRHYG